MLSCFQEEKSGVEHSPSSSSSLASVNEHSFVSSHASASVESESSSSSSFPSVALVASSDGAPINDLTELVTDPEVVEKTAAKSFVRNNKKNNKKNVKEREERKERTTRITVHYDTGRRGSTCICFGVRLHTRSLPLLLFFSSSQDLR